MNRATALAPGNGTKAMTSASTNPSTRQPTVAATASHTVVHSASRNAPEAKTSACRLRRGAAGVGLEGLLDDQGEGVEEDEGEEGDGRKRPQKRPIGARGCARSPAAAGRARRARDRPRPGNGLSHGSPPAGSNTASSGAKCRLTGSP